MIWAYYQTEKPFENNMEDLAFAMRSDEKIIRLLLRHYFKLDGEVWRHGRCDKVIAEYHSKSEKAAQSAKTRWTKATAKQTDSESNANALTEDANAPKNDANHKPITNNHKPIKKDKSAPLCVAVSVLVEKGFDEQTAEEFIAHKTKIKAPLTARAWSDHLSESEKAGWTPKAAAEKVMAKNWKGFEAKYVVNEPKQSTFTPPSPAITTPSREAIDPIMAMAIQESARTFKPVTEIYKSMKNKALGVAA